MAEAYTVARWKSDAITVGIATSVATPDNYPEIYSLMTEADKNMARALRLTIDPDIAKAKSLVVLQDVGNPNHIIESPHSFGQMLQRFRKGPQYPAQLSDCGGPDSDHGGDDASTKSQGKERKLNLADVEYDGGSSAVSYIQHLRYLVATYSMEQVLRSLPYAMKGEAKAWFHSLPAETKTKMDKSLDEWMNQLILRFRSDISVILREADAMRHSFDTEDTMDVRTYINKKYSLYREVGEDNDEVIIRRIHGGLDPTLALAVSMLSVYAVHSDNLLGRFIGMVGAVEDNARAQHMNIKKMVQKTVESHHQREEN